MVLSEKIETIPNKSTYLISSQERMEEKFLFWYLNFIFYFVFDQVLANRKTTLLKVFKNLIIFVKFTVLYLPRCPQSLISYTSLNVNRFENSCDIFIMAPFFAVLFVANLQEMNDSVKTQLFFSLDNCCFHFILDNIRLFHLCSDIGNFVLSPKGKAAL